MGPSEQEIIDRGTDVLRAALPHTWEIEVKGVAYAGNDPEPFLEIRNAGSGTGASFLVEPKLRLDPAEVRSQFGSSLARKLRATGGRELIVMSAHLSVRSQELLKSEGISFVDLAGNIWLTHPHALLHIERLGVGGPARTGTTTSLRGAKVGQVIRVLADVRPPYTGKAIARAAGVTQGYVSRVLELLSDEALIDRLPRGEVQDVSWADLLRERARSQTLLAKHTTSHWVSPVGIGGMPNLLRSLDLPAVRWALTGSLVASQVAPVAAPDRAVIRTDHPDVLASGLGLIPATTSGDVALVRSENDGAFERTMFVDDVCCVGHSQLAIDCLSGPGRMPAEGEALLSWMAAHETVWRIESIDALLGDEV
jgi:hypothetical protein